jgi:hypothetical protein
MSAQYDGDGARSQSDLYWWEQLRCCAEIRQKSGVKTVNAVILPHRCPIRRCPLDNGVAWIDVVQNGLPSAGRLWYIKAVMQR